VERIFATHFDADGPNVPLGALCRIETARQGAGDEVLAEVVRVDRDTVTLSPFDQGKPVLVGAKVEACGQADQVAVGPAFLGRAVDTLGRPIDNGVAPTADAWWPLQGRMPSPLDRVSPATVLETGVRAIDGVLTLGIGQRVGVFAPSGAGKTTLLSQIAQQIRADIVVICLVGERGREVESMWSSTVSAAARQRSILVAATSDQSAAMRMRAGHYALAHAEYWRARGKHVLFLLDSATRLAMAMREVGLAAGEPPTVRGYTPSVFATMPKLVERCGAVRSGGAISAIMTVLSETEDMDDPVCEMMKSLLDGHLLLSRVLAEQGQFPAIDILRSVSRQAEGLVGDSHAAQAAKIVQWLSRYDESRTLIETGLYTKGSNQEIDRAIERYAGIVQYLKQGRAERSELEATRKKLAAIAGSGN
jgi:flagellum-specific ATP synthase